MVLIVQSIYKLCRVSQPFCFFGKILFLASRHVV